MAKVTRKPAKRKKRTKKGSPQARARAARQRFREQQKRAVAARKGWAKRRHQDFEAANELIATQLMRAQSMGAELDVFGARLELAHDHAKRISNRTGVSVRDVYTIFLSPTAARNLWPWMIGNTKVS